MIEFLFVVFMAIGIAFVSNIAGRIEENTRLYDKCVVEFQDKPHKDVIELCKERVK